MTYFLVFTTVADEAQAVALARKVVQSKLVACVNVQPRVRSIYQWQGEVQDEPECLLMMKTREDRLAGLEKRLLAEHPYEVPEFLAIPVGHTSRPYLEWIDQCLEPDRQRPS